MFKRESAGGEQLLKLYIGNCLISERQETIQDTVLCAQSGVELELVESQPLLEWLANNYKSFGATLEIITDKSQEGSQFVRGFGGIGGETSFTQ